MSGERALRAALFATLALACRSPEPALLTVEQQPTDAGVRLTLVAAPGVRINALLQPVLERPEGSVLRFDAAGRSADSAYFVSPPTLDTGAPIAGVVRASVCPSGEQVCRPVTIAVRDRR